MGLVEAAAGGGRREALTELRDVLAEAVATCESMRDLASLSRQLQAVLREIDELPSPTVVSAADRIAERRTARSGG